MKLHTKIKALRYTVIQGVVFLMMLMVAHGALAASSFSGVQAYGVDTIAGYSALLTSSQTAPEKDLTFLVTKPDGATVKIPVKTDAQGIAKADLYDFHTKRAGQYAVAVLVDGVTNMPSYFTVYPDQVSTEQSSVVANKNIAKADVTDKVYVTVSLKDQYANAFQGHMVTLISSRADDTIRTSTLNAVTDTNGSVTFTVNSVKKGVSTYSALDVTSGSVLTSRAQVAYLTSSSYLQDVGGDFTSFLPVAEAAESGAIHNFDISNIPLDVQPNQNVSFTITARDQNNVTVQNYTGTVHFSADGSNGANVTLPEDYTFKAEDLGTHEFSLGIKFIAAGTYKIVATDMSNQIIKGEKSVTVGVSGGNQPAQNNSLKPVLATPSSGTYSQNVQTVSGSAAAGVSINIFDNDQEIGSVQANNSGDFTYQTAPLSDGEHALYVVTLDGNQEVVATSDTVEFSIDTTPPGVDQIEITPTSGITTTKKIYNRWR